MKRGLLLRFWILFMVGSTFGVSPEKDAILTETLDVVVETLPEAMLQQERFWFDWAKVAERVGAKEMRMQMIRSAVVASCLEGGSTSGQTLRYHMALFPKSPIVVNDLAYFMTTVEENPEEALLLLTGIPEIDREHVAIMDTFAWSYHRIGRKADALQAALRLLELSRVSKNSHPLSYSHAGDIFYTNGLYIEADTAWAHALRYSKHLSAEDALLFLDVDVGTIQRKRRAVRRLHPEVFTEEE